MLIKDGKWGWVIFWVIVCCVVAVLIAKWDYRARHEVYETYKTRVWVKGSFPHNVCGDGWTSSSFGRGTCSWHSGIDHTSYAIPGHYKTETASHYVKQNPSFGYLAIFGLIGAGVSFAIMSLRYLYVRNKK